MLGVLLVNSFIVALVVLIHYEFLYRFTQLMPILKVRHRFRVVLGVFSGLAAHTLEIWVFAYAYFLMNKAEGWGSLVGRFTGTLLDCAYFSFATYSTLGFGDIEPTGHIRFLTGLEALTGLVLITWTASFLYIEMQRYWSAK